MATRVAGDIEEAGNVVRHVFHGVGNRVCDVTDRFLDVVGHLFDRVLNGLDRVGDIRRRFLYGIRHLVFERFDLIGQGRSGVVHLFLYDFDVVNHSTFSFRASADSSRMRTSSNFFLPTTNSTTPMAANAAPVMAKRPHSGIDAGSAPRGDDSQWTRWANVKRS